MKHLLKCCGSILKMHNYFTHKVKQRVMWQGQSESGSQIEYAAVSKRYMSHELPAVSSTSAHLD